MSEEPLSTFTSAEEEHPSTTIEQKTRIPVSIRRRVIVQNLEEWQKHSVPRKVDLEPLPLTEAPRQKLEIPPQFTGTPSVTPTGKNTGYLEYLLRKLIFPLKLLVRFWRFSHILFILSLLTLITATGVLEYAALNRPDYSFYQVDVSTGSTLWQHRITSPMRTLLVDAQGSIVNTSVGKNLHQLAAFDYNGLLRWTSFSSPETFSIPQTTTRPGTVLVVLGALAESQSNTTTELNKSDTRLALYLLNRNTGHIIWQRVIVDPHSPNFAVVLGADAKRIYLASRENISSLNGEKTVAQLLAIDSATGQITWHTFALQESADIPTDAGKILLKDELVIWQVAGTIYAIDPTTGKISWHRYIEDNLSIALPQEESEMAAAASILVVVRSDAFHALDLNTGKERWNISNPGTLELPAGVLTSGSTFLIYSQGLLEAIQAINAQVIWSQKQLDTIQDAKISGDGNLIYLVLSNSVDGAASSQLMVALETKTGTARWTFEPIEQATFVPMQSDSFQYFRKTLFVSICLPDTQVSCARERLYALDGTTGSALWKIEAFRISDVHVSSDDSTMLFEANSSEWVNLIGRFRS